MKKCSVCGKEWEDSVRFCAACGGATVDVEAASVEEAAPVAPVVPVEEVAPAAVVAPVEAAAPVAAKSLKKWLPAGIALVAALAILITGLVTSWFGLTAPHRRIVNALKNTMTAKSYTLTTSSKNESDGYNSTSKSTRYLVVDEKGKTVISRTKGSSTYSYDNDGETRESGSEYDAVIEKDIEYEYYLDKDGKVNNAIITEIKDYAKDTLKMREMWDDPDWKFILKQQGWEESLKANKMEDLVEEVIEEYLSDRRWLKETAGMKKKGNTYTFNPDVKDLLKDVLDLVEDSKAFTNAAKAEVKEELTDMLEAIKEGDLDLDIELSLTIKGRYLTKVHLEMVAEEDGEKSVTELDMAYSDINKTEVSSGDVKKVKSKVNDWLEEKGIVYDKCGECKEFSQIYKDKLCNDCYYTCAECKEYGSNEKDGKRYCYDCYYVCDECGEYGSYEMEDGIFCYDHRYFCDKCEKRCDDANTVGEEQWCSDCFVCSECGENWPNYERDGKPVCYNCRYACDKCGKGCSSTYSVGEEEWCRECYVCFECGNYPSYTRDGKPVCYSCRYACDKCGKACSSTNTVGEEEWCRECYVCSECGGSWPSYMRDGKPVCYNCQYVCEECGEPCGYTYTDDGKEVCSDCHWDW